MTEPLALVASAERHRTRVALLHGDESLTYGQLLERSARAAHALLAGGSDLEQARVAYLVPSGFDHVVTQWGIWRAGGIAVPLCLTHPAPELEHVLDDARPSCVVVHDECAERLVPLAQARGLRVLRVPQLAEARTPGPLPEVHPDRGAMIIYTSGTTGKPKGALTTHEILRAQMRSIVQAWQITSDDRILHVLPLHHLHGILNALCSLLLAGGSCELLPRFDPAAVWARLRDSRDLTLFMGVPTMYGKLVAHWEAASDAGREALTAGAQRLRLMVSGSAALPASMLHRFEQISGHVLLERYGMTEIGMGLGNPLHGARRAGSVGVPFPNVEARIVDDRGRELPDGIAGQLEIRGPNVFREYWGRPEATREVLRPDGFFRTGDVAIREDGYYRLLGRESVDILKTGGYKVSALEIEEVLREHPAIAEVCVVGVPDEHWGQRVAAAVVLKTGYTLDLTTLRAFGKERLAPYKVPSLLLALPELPRNAMGKVQKPEVVKLWTQASG